MAQQGEDVYCTLLLSDSYLPGASVLANSLRDAGTKKKLAVMVTLDTVTVPAITELRALYDYILPVERIANPNPTNLYLMGRADLAFAFTKVNLWKLREFRKIVYIDADVVALRAPDELFDIEAPFAAAPDIGWPDAFNTGVMVLSPNMGDYRALRTLAAGGDSFDGADQGLLNQYFQHRNWHRISFTYNCTPSAQYQWEPAYKYYKSSINMVHFIGKQKPWLGGRPSGGAPGVYNELLARWWAVYDRHLKPPSTTFLTDLYPPASTIMQEPDKDERPTAPQQTAVPVAIPGTSRADYSSQQLEKPIDEPGRSMGTEAVTKEQTSEAVSQSSEPGGAGKESSQSIIVPVSTSEQRKPAPQTEWDATRAAPPAESKPEAANFPTQIYRFSEDKELFRAPTSYPEPPKDMYYKVPESKPAVSEKPKPIFPWEVNPPKATRVFAEDAPPPTPTLFESHSAASAEPDLPTDDSQGSDITATEPGPKPIAEDAWHGFSRTLNAWDTVPGIEEYVRAVKGAQSRRSKLEISPTVANFGVTEQLGHAERRPEGRERRRRESLILTDFPTEIERPSLPVTPAPIRRPSFWGEERDDAGELPAAEGVPDQADWNPVEKLEELRRNSLLGPEHLKLPTPRTPAVPLRELPEHSTPTTSQPATSNAETESSAAEERTEATTPSEDAPENPESSFPDTADQIRDSDPLLREIPTMNTGTIFSAVDYADVNEGPRQALVSPTER